MIDFGAGFWESTLAGAVRAGTPLMFAAVGELLYERSGVLNLAIEGMMLTGALTAVAVHVLYGDLALSIAAAVVVGLLFGVVHGFFCVRLRANQIAAGLAFVTLAQGATAFLGRDLVGKRVVADVPVPLSALADVPFLGAVLFRQDAFAYLAIACALGAWGFLYRTRAGVALRAIGEDAGAAEARGLRVVRYRIAAGGVAGALAALGGADLALAYASQWQAGMVAGRGWIALVLVICSLWNPRVLIAVALGFGGLSTLHLNLQASGMSVSSHLLGTLPFVASIVVLGIAGRWLNKRPLGMPTALGKPYQPLS